MLETIMFFVQGIPETTGLVGVSLAIIQNRFSWKNVLLMGLLLTFLSFVFRSFSFFFGLHTFIILFIIIFYVTRTSKVSIVKGFIACFISILILGSLEFISNTLFFTFSSLQPEKVMSDQILWALIGPPQALLMILLAMIIPHIKNIKSRGKDELLNL